MKYAFYGLSCCGKDTLIQNLISSGKFPGYTHPKGSETLNHIAQESFGKTFKELSIQEKESIRVQYADKLSAMENIFADGHYCFPKDNYYEIVFTENDAQCYDAFFYVKEKAETIKERILLSPKNQKFANLTIDEIDTWQKKEIRELRDICFHLNKDFIVLDNNLKTVVPFIDNYAKNHSLINCYQQANRLSNFCRLYAGKSKKIALFDCDRTIINEDSGSLYYQENGASLSPIRELFESDIYSMYQFAMYDEMSRFPKFPDTNRYHLNPIVTEKINNLRKEGYFIIGITSGIGAIWRDYNHKQKFADWVIASDYCFGFTICDFTKGFLSKILSQDCEVFACGDSLTDIYMLESATHGLIYAPGKIRSSVQDYINNHPNTQIKQFKQNPFQYNNIEAV